MILVCEGRAEERHDPVTHRALEVGEEHGDLLALAFEGALGGEDLLGKVLGGVGLGRDTGSITASTSGTQVLRILPAPVNGTTTLEPSHTMSTLC